MKGINIALISLYVIENSGIRVIARLLRDNGFGVSEIYFKDWINNRIIWPSPIELENLIKILKSREVDLIGISVRASAFIDIAKFVTLKLKEEINVPVIWGGIHPTSLPNDCIEIADAICVGEAEFAMLEFAEKFSKNRQSLPEDVLNFWVKKDKVVIKKAPRPLIDDLDVLPFKDFHSGDDKFYIDGRKVCQGEPCLNEAMYLMLASRGCVYSRCNFCINTMLNKVYPDKGYYYRRRGVSNVIEELLYAGRHLKHIKRIRFDDEIFPFDESWVDEFCDKYKQINLPFECHLHPLFVKEGQLRKLKTAGLDTVCIGIQNTQRINKLLYNRKETKNDILSAADILHRLKFKVCYQVILDDPVSTEEDKRNFFELLMSLPRPFELYLFSLTVYPKTSLSDKLLENKLISEEDIEGRNKKVFRQFRVDLAYTRPKKDVFWISLIILLSKNFIPKSMIEKMSKSGFLMRHPQGLAVFAQLCNIIKMAAVGFGMLIKGELSPAVIRRWLNFNSLITQ